MRPLSLRLPSAAVWAALALFILLPTSALADADDQAASPNSTTLGLQPIRGPIPQATAAPGESRVFQRADGAYQAIPSVAGRTKMFHIVERAAPWTLAPGTTVMANTYNGVVPGPAIVVEQGDTVVIDYTNDGGDARFDSLARDSRHTGDDGRRRRHLADTRSARRPFRLSFRGRSARHVHLSHARRRGDAGLGALRRDHRRCRRTRDRSNAVWRTISRDDFVMADSERRREPLHP